MPGVCLENSSFHLCILSFLLRVSSPPLRLRHSSVLLSERWCVSCRFFIRFAGVVAARHGGWPQAGEEMRKKKGFILKLWLCVCLCFLCLCNDGVCLSVCFRLQTAASQRSAPCLTASLLSATLNVLLMCGSWCGINSTAPPGKQQQQQSHTTSYYTGPDYPPFLFFDIYIFFFNL